MSFLHIALLSLSGALPSQQPPPAASEEAIIVVGERMRRLKLRTRTDRKSGAVRCVFKRRSGDEAFDAMMCDAVRGCAATVRTSAQMEACLKPNLDAFARELAARRNGQRHLPSDPR